MVNDKTERNANINYSETHIISTDILSPDADKVGIGVDHTITIIVLISMMK